VLFDLKGSDGYTAATANLANCLVVNENQVYFPNPGNQAFSNSFVTAVSGAVAVNVWINYHCKMGEIHCGTATIREIPVSPPWWDQLPTDSVWQNEQ